MYVPTQPGEMADKSPQKDDKKQAEVTYDSTDDYDLTPTPHNQQNTRVLHVGHIQAGWMVKVIKWLEQACTTASCTVNLPPFVHGA